MEGAPLGCCPVCIDGNACKKVRLLSCSQVVDWANACMHQQCKIDGVVCCRSELLQRVHQHNRQLQEEPVSGSRRARAARATPDQIGAAMRDSNIELINIMMEALEQEHEFL